MTSTSCTGKFSCNFLSIRFNSAIDQEDRSAAIAERTGGRLINRLMLFEKEMTSRELHPGTGALTSVDGLIMALNE